MLGKDPEAVVVSVATGDRQLATRMFDEIQALEPGRQHILVQPEEAAGYWSLRRSLRRYRIGLAPVLFDGDRRYRSLRRIAFLLAPTKILAYNRRLERHHLRVHRASRRVGQREPAAAFDRSLLHPDVVAAEQNPRP